MAEAAADEEEEAEVEHMMVEGEEDEAAFAAVRIEVASAAVELFAADEVVLEPPESLGKLRLTSLLQPANNCLAGAAHFSRLMLKLSNWKTPW